MVPVVLQPNNARHFRFEIFSAGKAQRVDSYYRYFNANFKINLFRTLNKFQMGERHCDCNQWHY